LGEEEAYACLKEEAYNVQLKREWNLHVKEGGQGRLHA
jgi:hypothetical protein